MAYHRFLAGKQASEQARKMQIFGVLFMLLRIIQKPHTHRERERMCVCVWNWFAFHLIHFQKFPSIIFRSQHHSVGIKLLKKKTFIKDIVLETKPSQTTTTTAKSPINLVCTQKNVWNSAKMHEMRPEMANTCTHSMGERARVHNSESQFKRKIGAR